MLIEPMTLHPQLIPQQGEPQFVILSYLEYQQLTQAVEDSEDLKTLNEEILSQKDAPTFSLAQIMKKYSVEA